MSLSTVDAFKHIHGAGTVTLSHEQLLALQQTLLEILGDIADVCSRHGITFVLGGGSCLGAVREHAFIPWDDDIDINMPRADYEKFVPVFREEMGDRYWVHTPQDTENYGLLLSRVLRKGTSVKTREDFQNPECGAFVDIFVIENTFNSRILRGVHGLGCMAFGFLVSCRKFRRDRRELTELARATGDRHLQRVFRTKILIGTLIAWRSLDGLVRHGDRWNALCRDGSSRLVSIPTGRRLFWGELYRREQVCRTVWFPYGKRSFPCPEDYQGYLARLYGQDYMTPPPEADRESHVFFEPFYLNDSEKS